MKLLVDIGNSRVKWATLDDGRLGEQRAARYTGWAQDDWRRSLFAVPGIDEVVAASVSAAPSAALAAAASFAIGRPATFVSTSREAGGVRNAYREPQLLGVDRWLAVIAGHATVRGACCIADVGTAATFDTVTGEGDHLGGFIIPGPGLMVQSLHGATADLAGRTAASGVSGGAPLADNTRDAIERGCRLAVAAMIDRGVGDVESRLGAPPALLLTGGAAPSVVPLLRSRAMLVPDLVLRGLALLAGAWSANYGGKPQSE
jgi:type III pantothenate kinase